MKQADISRLLPEVYQRAVKPDTPLSAILAVMEGLHAPSERALDTLADNFSAYRAPDPFIVLLAHFLDLDRYIKTFVSDDDQSNEMLPSIASGSGRLRELLRRAAELSRWRGTAQGLKLFLEVATGQRGFDVRETVTDAHGERIPFHIQVVAPTSALVYQDLVGQIVEQEKPAYVTCEIVFAQAGDHQ